jgi:hypothetical protein
VESPSDGLAVNWMVPVKPFKLMTAIVVLQVEPVLQVGKVIGEVGVMVKSVTLRLKVF